MADPAAPDPDDARPRGMLRGAQPALAGHPDYVVMALISGKTTCVHRDLWPSLLAVALSHRDEELLPRREKALLAMVEKDGAVDVDNALAERLDAYVGNLGRELESRLLVLGLRCANPSGARRLVSWTKWAKDAGVQPAADLEAARARLDAAARAVGEKGRLPWWPRSIRQRW